MAASSCVGFADVDGGGDAVCRLDGTTGRVWGGWAIDRLLLGLLWQEARS